MKSEFRSLPSVDKLISDERIKDLEVSYSRPLVVEVVRQVLEDSRLSISRGEPAPSSDSLVESVSDRVRTLAEPSLRPVDQCHRRCSAHQLGPGASQPGDYRRHGGGFERLQPTSSSISRPAAAGTAMCTYPRFSAA